MIDIHTIDPGDESQGGLEERLERGQILVFPKGSLPLPSKEDQAFLRDEVPAHLIGKNISYNPAPKRVFGVNAGKEVRDRVKRILLEQNEVVQRLLGQCLPNYAKDWMPGKINVRPIQEKDRKLSVRASSERIHVDAQANGATHGDRILRFFTNIHPTETRVWRSAGLFPELWHELHDHLGLHAPVRTELRAAGRLYNAAIQGVARILPVFGELQSSPYDRAMKRFHNGMKFDEAFQNDPERSVRIEFPPYSSWAVLTDTVSHAVTSGQHALVHTFHVRLTSCRLPDLAPIRVIQATAG